MEPPARRPAPLRRRLLATLRKCASPSFAVIAAAFGLFIGVCVSPVGAADCGAIQDSYASAIRQAQVCDLAKPDSCSTTRPWSPQDVCRCQVAVNPANIAQLDELLAQFKAQECPFAQRMCTRICVAPAHRCAAGAGPSPTCTGT